MWEYQDLLTLKSSKAFNQKKKFQSHLLPPRVIINFIHKRTASNPPISLHKIPNPSLKIHEPKPKTQEKKKMLRFASKKVLGLASQEAASRPVQVLPRLYHERVIEHYDKPRNVGSLDKNDPTVGTGLVGAPACGDVMKLQIKVDENTGKIVDARFKTFGCGSAIASSSVGSCCFFSFSRYSHCLAAQKINRKFRFLFLVFMLESWGLYLFY